MLNTITTKKLMLFFATILSSAFSGAFQPEQEKDNVLTAAEKRAGWVLLFNGQNTDGWRGYGNKPFDSWEVTNGQLYCKAKDVTQRADLMTIDQYDNFELSVDWKVDKGANSGIIYRVQETSGPSHVTGPEYQLIDDEGYPHKLEAWQKSGADYAMYPPLEIAAKPAGEYNHTTILVNGAHVEHWLNGKKVVEYDLWTPDWQKLKAEGKWSAAKAFGLAKKGHIAFQDHGGGIWFKNVKLRKLK
ncbi:3-keto-disaccharide hydrolase [Longitalea luteola]|uniref:3-keto-disaccharide hydrolase n=1 Tax=Longitalea luteola TaxID=2812563 RepID=UPI001F6040D0|nr:DUF1080 domain-containing protein [Longitalea luteola]